MVRKVATRSRVRSICGIFYCWSHQVRSTPPIVASLVWLVSPDVMSWDRTTCIWVGYVIEPHVKDAHTVWSYWRNWKIDAQEHWIASVLVVSAFFFLANFRHLAEKKRGLANLTKEILGIVFKNSPYFEEKRLEVGRFSQCVTIGRQN